MNKIEEYWKKRALLIENENFKNTEYHLQKIKEQYEEAKSNIQKEIDKFYADFAINNQVQLLDAKRILDNNELKEFRTTLSQYKKMVEADNEELLQKINNISIRHRITRLQSLQEKIDILLQQLNDNVDKELNSTLIENIENSYYKSMYDLEKILKVHTDFSFFSTKIVDDILTFNWSGVLYSNRIWRNQTNLRQSLIDSLNKNFIQGNSINQLATEMSKALDRSYSNCQRLLRTEVNYANNKATIEAYKEKGIKRYVYVATLDLKTSKVCQDLDGKAFEVGKMVVGVNCPPMHPNCRSTIMPYVQGLLRNRVARNIETGKNEEVGNLTYKEWYQKYVEDKYSQEEIEKIKKKFIHFSSDKALYSKYKQVLDKDFGIERFDKFQDLKYNDIGTWTELKEKYELKKHYDKVIATGELSPFVDFATYREIDNNIRQNLVGLKTKNGIAIKSYSKHFVDRICGSSMEQKRSGVSIEDVKDTILQSNDFKILEKSTVITGKNNKVSINHYTGNLIQTNPYIRRKGKY